jgi:hypothetical protein
MESAVLQGAHPIGLASNHSDLIKFDSVSSEKFGPIKVAISNMVRSAKTNARKRTFLSGQTGLTQRTVNQVRQALEGVDMRMKYRSKVGQRPVSS